MQKYTVIWRDQSDQYMFTEIETADDPADLSSLNWVQIAASIEYADYPPEELRDILDDFENGYDLLDVVKGKMESVL